jgi:CubicO group peptidase (beta-lactamase class C family)
MQQIRAITKAAETAADTLGVNLETLCYLDSFLQSFVDRGEHSFISFYVLRRGTLIFNGNYGVQTPGGEPLREDAIYPVASVTKPFTATCCAILQERGLLDFWDKLQKYFPGFTGEGKEKVLLWHLLCHTTGMTDTTTYKFIAAYIADELGIKIPEENGNNKDEIRALYMQARDKMGLPKMESSVKAVKELFFEIGQKAPLDSEPGTAFTYYGVSYDLIARIVERVSGKSLEEFARENIFEPLGMRDTHWFLPVEKRDRMVRRDPSFKGGQWLNSEDTMVSTSASGGLKSSMADLARFGQMFLQGGTLGGKRIISPATVRLMTKDQNEKLPDTYWQDRRLRSNWGLGWDIKNGKKDDLGMLRSERSYNHGGYGGARLLIDPDAELVVAIYMVEQREDSFYDDMGTAVNVLYAALD